MLENCVVIVSSPPQLYVALLLPPSVMFVLVATTVNVVCSLCRK